MFIYIRQSVVVPLKIVVLSRTHCGVRALFVVDVRMRCVEMIFVSNNYVKQRQCRLKVFTYPGSLHC